MKKAICYGSVPAPENHRQRLALIKDAGFDGIEAPQFDSRQEAEDVRDLAEETGLEIHSVMGSSHWRVRAARPSRR